MKKILNRKNAILASIIILLSGCSTVKYSFVDVEPYKRIITVQDKSKTELYILANCWLVEAFVSAEAVIQFQDREAGKIIGKCTLTPPTVSKTPGQLLFSPPVKTYTIRCVISVDCKDNAVKITFKSSDSLNKTDADNLKIKWISLADQL
jgi:hypothetical protein